MPRHSGQREKDDPPAEFFHYLTYMFFLIRSSCAVLGFLCVSTPVSKDTTLALSFPMILYSSRGPAHGITTLANEASDVMGSSQRRLTVYLQFLIYTKLILLVETFK